MIEASDRHIVRKPDIPFVAQEIRELQISHPDDWIKVVVDIYDERTILAASLYESLLRLREERKI